MNTDCTNKNSISRRKNTIHDTRSTIHEIDEKQIEEKLALALSEAEFKHALRTRAKAEKLARIYGVDVEKARLAGLLHDYGRCLTDDELVEGARKMGLEPDQVELKFPVLLHGLVGAKLVSKVFLISDGDILQAIALHTVGASTMTSLDKVVYLADKLEVGREHEGVARLRTMIGQASLEEIFREAYLHSIVYVIKKGGMLHPSSVEAWNSIVDSMSGKGRSY